MRKSTLVLLAVPIAIVVSVCCFGAYLFYLDTPCGMSHRAKKLLLTKLSPGDASTLREYYSIAEPQCPDVFLYRQGEHLDSATAWDVAVGGEPRPRQWEQACRFDGLALPKTFKVLATFAPPLNHHYDSALKDSDGQMPVSDVQVEVDARQPVVVMLMAYGPTVWNVDATSRTKLLGVFVNATHRQWITGVDRSVPTFISTEDDKGGCGWMGGQEVTDLTATYLFGRPAEPIKPSDDGADIVRLSDER